MRGKYGLVVVALAAIVLVASAADSQAGRRRRGCTSCGSYPTSCYNGTCTVVAPVDTETAKADVKAPDSVAIAKESQQPATTVAPAPPTRPSYVTRRGRRRWRR